VVLGMMSRISDNSCLITNDVMAVWVNMDSQWEAAFLRHELLPRIEERYA
jgi:hypothetical protein